MMSLSPGRSHHHGLPALPQPTGMAQKGCQGAGSGGLCQTFLRLDCWNHLLHSLRPLFPHVKGDYEEITTILGKPRACVPNGDSRTPPPSQRPKVGKHNSVLTFIMVYEAFQSSPSPANVHIFSLGRI